MTEKFCAGIDVENHRAIALIVGTKTGRIAAVEFAATEMEAFARAKSASKIETLLAIGFSQKPAALPRDTARIHISQSRAHASFPGAAIASPSTMLLAFDHDHCALLINSRIEAHPTTATMIPDSILPGFFGYTFAPIPVNPSVDPKTFSHTVRERCESLRSLGVPVRRFVAAGPASPDLLQDLADVLDGRIKLAASEHPAALGAAILAAISVGHEIAGHASQSQLIHAMAQVRRDLVYRPDVRKRRRHPE